MDKRNQTVKHQSRIKLKLTPTVLAVASAVVIGLFVAFALHLSGGQAKSTKLVLGAGSSASSYNLETVTDPAAQAKGLGGRASLDKQAGMLFSYDNSEQRCMWMKDMKFNIDIIWLDASKRVVSVVPNLSPSTYPQSYCAASQYVVELNAGVARQNGLRVGQTVKF